jgi:hypothetical protein
MEGKSRGDLFSKREAWGSRVSVAAWTEQERPLIVAHLRWAGQSERGGRCD